MSDVHKAVFIDVYKNVFMSFMFQRVRVGIKKLVVNSIKQRQSTPSQIHVNTHHSAIFGLHKTFTVSKQGYIITKPIKLR